MTIQPEELLSEATQYKVIASGIKNIDGQPMRGVVSLFTTLAFLDNILPADNTANGNLKPEDKELRELKRKLYDLEEENAILEKTVAIFTKPTK